MFRRHVSRLLAAHVDGELPARDRERIESHLTGCEQCRAEREEVRFAMAMLDHLPAVPAPDAIWTAIEAATPRPQPHRAALLRPWRFAMAGLALVVLAVSIFWVRRDVIRIHGSVTRVATGRWLQTDSSSRATMTIGDIGVVEVAPNTRLKVVTDQPGEHRLELARGEIRAKISAPPRLFFVNTASGTAVDLGCEYTLTSDEDGTGLLQVTKGWVSFQGKGPESLVPAGASCRIHPVDGAGVPYFDDAPEQLKQALESRSGSVDAILAAARVRDTLTLWHLLSRVNLAERGRIYDRIAALTPVPAGVTRDQVLNLDPATLTSKWKDELAWTW